MNNSLILIALAVAVLVLTRLAARGGTRNVLLVVASFFVYFAFGPVLNLLLGNPVYAGTVLSAVEAATVGFVLALLGMAAGDAVAPQRRTFDDTLVSTGERIYPLLVLVYLSLATYGIFILSTRFGTLLVAQKDVQLAAVGDFHYQYLLLQLAAVSTFFIAGQTRLQSKFWTVNTAVYVAYCLLTSERDFLFVLLAILIHREMLGNRRRTARVAFAGVFAALAATALFAARSAGTFTLSAALNQGSILFVDTFLRRHVPESLPFQWGGTYLEALLRALPLAPTRGEALSEWLVRTYAPGGLSGYGFSLTGEAYMNFGVVGIPAIFFVFTVAHRFLVNRSDRADSWLYASVYSTAVWMYVLRGDSTQLLGSLFYGALFMAALHATSASKERLRRRVLASASGRPPRDSSGPYRKER